MKERKIIHIDMDAFYASVEQRDHPELRGIPMAVGWNSERGVIATASYEARRYGVHSAMATKRALQLCPELVIVEGNHQKYSDISHQIREVFHEYTDLVEPLSCDEAFLDVTVNKSGIPLAVDIAREIKRKIHDRLSLTASAGVSYNKFLAKIASDLRKPDGLCTIHPSIALEFLDSLPIENFWGVGKVTARKMRSLGIYNGYTLRQWSKQGLSAMFGKMGAVYYEFARGVDHRPVEPDLLRKSVGCECTFEHDLVRRSEIIIELYHIVEELIRRLEKQDFHGHTLTLKLKYSDFSQSTRSVTSETEPFLSMRTILPAAKLMLKESRLSSRPIRLIGLSVSNVHGEQILLLEDSSTSKIVDYKQLSLDF